MKLLNQFRTFYRQCIWLSIIVVGISSCKMEEIAALESVKNIQGSWQITKATRNGTDITNKFDFTLFRVIFNDDGSYQIQNSLPFIVSTNGSYALDDPQYPFHIQFTETESERAVGSGFDYPIVGEGRILTLTFSAGCSSNMYSYMLEKTNNP
ncbi:DUF5004 domain-containing protein [Olivibacter sp. CPCC 100613]|uniref:DUF5004 domain-containing protein n=1 Tax=Olivibacter sp. CPCC 100613 TaxID=3079931 RepID=UPI002FFA8C97